MLASCVQHIHPRVISETTPHFRSGFFLLLDPPPRSLQERHLLPVGNNMAEKKASYELLTCTLTPLFCFLRKIMEHFYIGKEIAKCEEVRFDLSPSFILFISIIFKGCNSCTANK